MAKTNAERQREYRERKKANEGQKYLAKERARQQKNYKKVKDLSKKELRERREAVKLRVQKHRCTTKKLLEASKCDTSLTINSSTASSPEPAFLVAMNFPKRGESSRKRKRRSDDCFYKKIRKLQNEKQALQKSNATLRQRVHRMKKKQGCQLSGQEMTPNKSVSLLLRSNGLSPSKTSKQLKKSLLFSEVVSKEIKASVLERKNKRESIRRILSGKILRKYKLIKYAAAKTGSDRRKLCRSKSKVLNFEKNKRGFDPDVYEQVLEFYARDDVSTALPGKRDAKKVKKRKARLQKRSLNDYLSNLYEKLKAEKPYLKVSFSSFAKMRPANYVLANFVNRRSCLCTKHQNVALKLKMLKTHNKTVPVNPELFIKNFSSDEIQKLLDTCKVTSYSYEEWQKVKVNIKTRSGEEKVKEKMKVVSKTKTKLDFETCFKKEILAFREHVKRIKNQFAVQRNLKENLPANHIYIHMDFAEDYRCRSQEEIQSAYWSQTQVTIHPVVAYFKKDDKLCHQSYVFISDEPRHDAKFVFALLRSLVPQLIELIPTLEYIHYWTDLPMNQYRNKTIFKIISCHTEYFNVSASWNYMEAGHGKGPCDPIGGTAKRKADLAVKNEKAIIQDAQDFFKWAKTTEDASLIKFTFLSRKEYEDAKSFLNQVCNDITRVEGTLKLHAVFPHEANRIWVRDLSCFCKNCFTTSFQSDTACKGWRLANLKLSNAPAPGQNVSPDIGDHVAAVYKYDQKVYVGKVIEFDESEVHISFYKHNGSITNNTIFNKPKRKDEVWTPNDHILCVLPELKETKRGKKYDKTIVDVINQRFTEWKSEH